MVKELEREISSCVVGGSLEPPTYFIRKNRADALLRLLTQPHSWNNLTYGIYFV